MQTKIIEIWVFGWGHFDFLMDAITESGNVSTHFIMIKYTVDHQYTNFHTNIRKYNKVIKILSFQWRPFWKFKMEVSTAARSRVFISYMILTIKNYQYTQFHATIHMYNKVIDNFEFLVAAILKIQYGGHYCSQITRLHSDIILTIKNDLYTKYQANIHMPNKVIDFFNFQWRPFWKFKMTATTAARSRVFISYIILTIKNYQHTKFHAFMTIWTMLVFDVP